MRCALAVTQRNEAIHREARAALRPRGSAGAGSSSDPFLVEHTPVFELHLESRADARGASGSAASPPDTIEIVRVERGRDVPRSRLAEALAGVRGGGWEVDDPHSA